MRPCFEHLEDRSLMTTAALVDGVLTITGTEGADWIDLQQEGSQVTLGDQSWMGVEKIVIFAKGGDDVILLRDHGQWHLPAGGAVAVATEIHCGDGNDIVGGGWGN